MTSKIFETIQRQESLLSSDQDQSFCFITYDEINFIATNESRRESNLTDSLLKNLKLLLNLSQQNNRIDLICLNNVVVVDGDGDGDGDGVNGVDCGHQHLMRTTITFQMKKIISFGLILAYLIEWTTMMMMMMILYETLILNKIIQFCCSILLSFIVTNCTIYYQLTQKNRIKHQWFTSLYWISMFLEHLWQIAKYFIPIHLDHSLWSVCNECLWKSSDEFVTLDSIEIDFRQENIFDDWRSETDSLIDSNRLRRISLAFNLIYLILFLSQFILAFYPDRLPKANKSEPKFNPENYSSILGRSFFIWMDSIVFNSYRKTLKKSDILETNISVKIVEEQLSKQIEIDYKKLLNKSKRTLLKSSSIRLILILMKKFGWEFLKIFSIKFIPTLLTFLGPLLLNRLISYASDENDQQYRWHGFLYAFVMFKMFLLESILNSFADYRLMVLALKIRSSLTMAIYRRLLRMNPTSTSSSLSSSSSSSSSISSSSNQKQFTSGQILNIMSSDTQKVFDYIKMINLFWICPLQITIAIFLLWQHLGYASLAGLGVLLLLLPFNAFIGAQIRSLQTRLLIFKDRRFRCLNETLAGIRAIKLYAWEEFFHQKITEIRNLEIRNLKFQAIYSSAITFAFTSAPFFVALSSFFVFLYCESDSKRLDASKAFVSLAIFNIIRRPLAFFPQLITNSMMFIVSLKRISEFLEPSSISANDSDLLIEKREFAHESPMIRIENCRFDWNKTKTDGFELNISNLSIEKPGIWAFVGEIGSAFVPQNSWIQTGTIRDNILFGNRFDPILYWQVIESCALIEDLEHLPDADRTMIGEKGFNLSGGQRQRISIARAIYSQADIYLFDDPLSALDSQVSRHIFQKVLSNRGLIGNKIRILTTHDLSLMMKVDGIFLLQNGSLVSKGSFKTLVENENEFTEFLVNYFSSKSVDDQSGIESEIETEIEVENEEDYDVLVRMAENLEHRFSSFSRNGSFVKTIKKKKRKLFRTKLFRNKKSDLEKRSKNDPIIDYNIEANPKTGSISYRIYWNYARLIGLFSLLLIVVFFTIGHCFLIFTNLWLSSWSNDQQSSPESAIDRLMKRIFSKFKILNQSQLSINQWQRFNIYAGLGILQTIFILMATMVLNFAGLRGSKQIHQSILDRILHVPIKFFSTTTSGQILNRFNKDVDLVDSTLISSLRLFFIEIFRSLALFVIVAIGTNSPITIVLLIPLIVIYCFIYKYYVSTSRQLMRLESILRTPIYLQFNESYSGAKVIQAFGKENYFLESIAMKIDSNTSALHMSLAASRWLSVRLECLGNLIVLITAISCVLLKGQITPGMVGLCITSSLSITTTLNLLIRSSTELETNIVAIERLMEYVRLPQEIDFHQENRTKMIDSNNNEIVKTKRLFNGLFRDHKRKKSVNLIRRHPNNLWLYEGLIEFRQFSARYHQTSMFCLKNINLIIEPGLKIGIVGRTGAGKSSIVMALFRLLDGEMGEIFISGHNIKELSLHQLRSGLNIIPQESFLFTGTLRENLDPFVRFDDEKLIETLRKAHLGFLATNSNELQKSIEKSIDGLSFGQKQLFCLARALLYQSKILILDEATAGIDPMTDRLVQEIIRKEFACCTVLTIAHRLKTILDYDRILVLDRGEIIEFDSPQSLLSNQSSQFFKMISS
ncbi:Multidrug resistance-associated protein 1 [Sarcoptes scabiei]|uniref:Multidrug resistance-associated protein 1 n=1 Tax=Sarcoptes scabiei TaxID=52283 RepID=A0A834REF3_SARSC|nr:Multidrug resistance-associated protein 1 [Sarcoptes scabiei]